MTTSILDALRNSLSTLPPLTLADNGATLKFELKPYLQPFEKDLAVRELRALLAPADVIEEKHGFWTATTRVPEALLREQLTYWQRVGRDVLEPTSQTLLELSQNGREEIASPEPKLHRARRLRFGPHGIHEYRGKFFPQLVRSLITVSGVGESALVLDPMCGSGTAPCEALAFSRGALGVDLNPLSVLISRVKCSVASSEAGDLPERAMKALERFKYPSVDAQEVWSPHDLEYMERWFDPEAIVELASILTEIRSVKAVDAREFLQVCLSNIVRSISWQKEVDLRVRKDVRPYIPGTGREHFETAVRDQVERISPYLSLLPKRRPDRVSSVKEGDSIRLQEIFPEHVGGVDLIITSPPYATALPYLDTDRLSLVALGLLPRNEHQKREARMIGSREISESQREREWVDFLARKKDLPPNVTRLILDVAEHYHSDEVGFRRRNLPALLGKYFLNMLDAMIAARAMMRPSGSAFYVVGNNSTRVNGDRVEIPTDQFLFEIGEAAGWQGVEMINMELLHSRDIFRDNRGSKETILWFCA